MFLTAKESYWSPIHYKLLDQSKDQEKYFLFLKENKTNFSRRLKINCIVKISKIGSNRPFDVQELDNNSYLKILVFRLSYIYKLCDEMDEKEVRENLWKKAFSQIKGNFLSDDSRSPKSKNLNF